MFLGTCDDRMSAIIYTQIGLLALTGSIIRSRHPAGRVRQPASA